MNITLFTQSSNGTKYTLNKIQQVVELECKIFIYIYIYITTIKCRFDQIGACDSLWSFRG